MGFVYFIKESAGKPSETDPIKSQISSKTYNWKKTAQKDAIKDITSDSRVNSDDSHTGGHRLV